MTKYNQYLLGVFVFLMPIWLSAQEDEVTPISFRTLAFAGQSSAQTGAVSFPNLYFFDGKTVQQIRGRVNQFSNQYKFLGSLPLNIYDRPPQVSEGQLVGGRLAVSIRQLPEESKDLLIIFSKDANDQLRALPLAGLDVGEGDRVIKTLNLSQQRAAVKLGDKRFALEPLGHTEFSTGSIEATDGVIQVAVEDQESADWRLVYSKYTPIAAVGSHLVLIHRTNFTSGPWKVSSFRHRSPEQDEIILSEEELSRAAAQMNPPGEQGNASEGQIEIIPNDDSTPQ